MKNIILFAAAGLVSSASASDLLISGVLDGDLSGGTPKAVELYVLNDIADLSLYGIGAANNGGGTDGQETTLSGSATAGDYIYINNSATDTNFDAVFGFSADFSGSGASINGDDAVELFFNGLVVDTYGDPDVNGDNESWDYTDSWAYRNDFTSASASFNDADWSFGGRSALDGLDVNQHASTIGGIFGSYVPAPGAFALLALGGLVGTRRQR